MSAVYCVLCKALALSGLNCHLAICALSSALKLHKLQIGILPLLDSHPSFIPESAQALHTGMFIFQGGPFSSQTRVNFFPIPFFARFAHILTLSVALNSLIMHKKHNRSLKTHHKALNSCKKSKFLIFSSICASFLPPNGYEAYFLPSPPTTALLLSYTHPCCHNTQSPASIFLVF